MKEAEKLIKGSVHEDYFLIVHDSLLLMTDKETITWMRYNNYFRRWFLPMNGLQDGTPYGVLPVDTIPEFIPLDNSLNRDILWSLCFHCFLSRFVLNGEVTND